MFSIINIVAAISLSIQGTAPVAPIDALGQHAPTAKYMVHFVNPTYPVTTWMGFASEVDANNFAQAKRSHGYLVRVEMVR